MPNSALKYLIKRVGGKVMLTVEAYDATNDFDNPARIPECNEFQIDHICEQVREYAIKALEAHDLAT
jgi:hypothetical protein